MASKSAVAKNKKRKRLVEVYSDKRAELKSIWLDASQPDEERERAQRKLASLPRNSSKVRIRNRCALTGRPRAYYRKFGLSRIALRDLALRGDLPGVIKASW
jgi:small subunit ribosomal protein S14